MKTYTTRAAPRNSAVEPDTHTTVVRHGPYGPHVIRIAHFLVAVMGNDLIDIIFEEVDRRWPDLSFNDFLGAAVLAQALALEPQGAV